MTTMEELLLFEARTAELPEVPAEIAHLIVPEQVAATRQEAKASGRRYFVGRPDKFGGSFRYASNGTGVLETLRANRAAVASGEKAAADRRYRAGHLEERLASNRRYYATPDGAAASAVANARRSADQLGVARRPFCEEYDVLAPLAKLAFRIKQVTGTRVDCHHGLRSLADGGEHSFENIVLLSASTHRSWHTTARHADRPVRWFMKKAIREGTVVKHGDAWVEKDLLDRYLAAIQPTPCNDNAPLPTTAAA